MRILSVGIVRASEDSCNNAGFRCQRLAGQLRQDLSGRRATVFGEFLRGLQHVRIDVKGRPHRMNITHHASDVNGPRSGLTAARCMAESAQVGAPLTQSRRFVIGAPDVYVRVMRIRLPTVGFPPR